MGITIVDKKITLMELHHRKYNLLFYGVRNERDERNEDVHTTLLKVFVDIGIPKDDANKIQIAKAHRLPRKTYGVAAAPSNKGPEPIIANFILMRDHDHVLSAYESKPKNARPTASSENSSGVNTVRSNLPPLMKARSGKLVAIAYKLRTEKNLSTKIFAPKLFSSTTKRVRDIQGLF